MHSKILLLNRFPKWASRSPQLPFWFPKCSFTQQPKRPHPFEKLHSRCSRHLTLSVSVPQSGVKLVSSDSRHLASLKKGGPERGRFFVSPGPVHSPFAMKSEKAGSLRISAFLIAFLSRPHSVVARARSSREPAVDR